MAREIVDWRLAEYLGGTDEPDEPDAEALHAGRGKPQLWEPYHRKQIAALFGLKFSTGNWNAGWVRTDGHIFLLVTLSKETKTPNFQYSDRFLAPDVFNWQSQNQTKQESKPGREIRNHKEMGVLVHLFVRRDSKTPTGKGAPFYYCGDVEFVDWQGEMPITVQWRLRETLPPRLQATFADPKAKSQQAL